MPRVKTATSRSRKLVQVRLNNGDSNGITNDDDDTSSEDEEQTQIKDLCQRLPQLAEIFHVHSKIGEGTFSTVYLGSLKQHDLLPDTEKRWFAIKHLVPTAHPARVEHELRCLKELGGKDNVINIELCLRNQDNVVFIMPYIPHKKFSELIATFTASSLREYVRALATALRHVHSRGVIHRDVKPSNFLYDPGSGRYQLIDFGLAQRIESLPSQTAKVSVQRAPLGDKLTNLPERDANGAESRPSGAERRPSGAERATNGAENVLVDDGAGASRTLNGDAKLCNDRPMKRPREEDVALPEAKRAAAAPAPPASPRARASVPAAPAPPKSAVPACACLGRGGVCRGAGAGAGSAGGCAGRPPARAPRAGTQGFRPPEVLLKYTHQTTAVDMWALGVVVLSGVCARYPLLRARDDAHALAELCALVGARALAAPAAAARRRLLVSRAPPPVCLRRLCARLRGAPLAPRRCAACRPRACLCRDPDRDASQFEPQRSVAGFPDSLFSLLYRLLDPDPRTRISAAEALEHPFFTQPDPDPL